MIPCLDDTLSFPPHAQALREPNGLLAMGGDLSVARLVSAYKQGIFPWFNPGDPVLWWSPDPRTVLFTDELHVRRSLDKVLRNRHYQLSFDRCFPDVLAHCAAATPERPLTWITAEVQAAYLQLHACGIAHSVEIWMEGQLVGGLYGVALGRMFYGESMFSRANDGSKIALVHLTRHLAQAGFTMIDCQMWTAHLASLGARSISRDEFLAKVRVATAQPAPATLWTERVHSHEPSRR